MKLVLDSDDPLDFGDSNADAVLATDCLSECFGISPDVITLSKFDHLSDHLGIEPSTARLVWRCASQTDPMRAGACQLRS
jgi:hypothetical protein